MTKVLVIGSSGLVGTKFVRDASKKADVTGVDEKVLDITKPEEVSKYFSSNADKFDSVVNFAAVTDVDGAEKERGNEGGFVWKLNVEGVKNLAQLSSKYDKHLIQISTDFVYDGTNENPGPYAENLPIPNSMDNIGWYGWTKNRAEEILKGSDCSSSIVRIAYPFYSDTFEKKLDFAKNYLKLYDAGNLFPIFTDQTFSPLLVDDLADPILKILDERVNGVFHVVSKNIATPFEFVEYLLKKARNVDGVVKKGSMEEFLKAPGRTPRPRLGGLKTEKTEKELGFSFKTWQEMVDQFCTQVL